MFSDFGRFLFPWVEREPVAFLVIIVTGILLAGAFLLQKPGLPLKPWLLAARMTAALAFGLGFLGLSLLLEIFFQSSISGFSDLYTPYPPKGGMLSEEWRKEIELWGGPVAQYELSITHYVERTVTETVEQIQGPTLYRNLKVVEKLEQDSLMGFTGHVDIQRLDRPVQDPLYNAFLLDAVYEYEVLNQADEPTRASFAFPLPTTQNLRDFHVIVDGKEAAPRTIASSQVRWELPMRPHQTCRVIVSYRTQGREYFNYGVMEEKVIQHFSLVIALNTGDASSSITPQTEAVKNDVSTITGKTGKIISWVLSDPAILAPQINVWIWPAPRTNPLPGRVITLASGALQALLYFLPLVTLVLLICGQPVQLGRLVLLGAVFCLQFLGIMGTVSWFQTLPVPTVIFSLIGLSLVYFLDRKLRRLLQMLILFLYALCAVGYPISRFLPQESARNAFDGFFQSAMLLFLFGLTLLIRLRKKAHAPSHPV